MTVALDVLFVLGIWSVALVLLVYLLRQTIRWIVQVVKEAWCE